MALRLFQRVLLNLYKRIYKRHETFDLKNTGLRNLYRGHLTDYFTCAHQRYLTSFMNLRLFQRLLGE